MPTSAFEGRGFFTNHLLRVVDDIDSVVDFGPGEGTYSILGRHIVPRATWRALEIYPPYVSWFGLKDKYDHVMVGDMRTLSIEPYGLAIFGDVLEHLTRDDAERVLRTEAERCRYLYVSVPIISAPQGAHRGNEAEAHLYDWEFEEMSDLLLSLSPVMWDAWRGHVVGRWWVDLHN